MLFFPVSLAVYRRWEFLNIKWKQLSTTMAKLCTENIMDY